MEISRASVLQVVNRAASFSKDAENDDEEATMLAGLMPKRFITRYFHVYPAHWIQDLLEQGYIRETDSYLIPNPKRRTRPIATRYESEKPRPPSQGRPITYRVRGRDRLLLWYAAANEDLSGSRGEAYGLWKLCEFFRDRRVQKIWRRYISRPLWKLPEDAL